MTLRVTGGKADVTVPFEELQRIFDIAVGSMDFGSGFLDTEEIETLRRLAVRLGVDPAKATSSTFKGQYPHQFMSYTVPDGSRVLCSYCMGTDPDKGHMPTDQYAAYCRSLL